MPIGRNCSESDSSELCSIARCFFQLRTDTVQLHHFPLQLIEEEIDHRRGEEREHLRHQQPADNRYAQRLRAAPNPRPCRCASGSPPNSAAIVVIMIGLKRSRHAW